MSKPFDISKFRKTLTKSVEGMSIGFHDPTDWISTGNYALNYLISGDFNRGVPLGKVTIFAGESGCLPATAMVTVRLGCYSHASSVGELRELIDAGHKCGISTPHGYRSITDWFDKGVLPLVEVVATISGVEYRTTCAEQHLLQTAELELPDSWTPAVMLQVGDDVLTEGGWATVKSVTPVGAEECFDFTVDDPTHCYWGDGFSSHNSGKSYICSGNIIRNAQAQGIFVVVIDSENALDEKWLQDLGVDTSEDKLLRVSMSMIDDVAKTISEFTKSYKETAPEDRPKVLFVIDSLGMLLTPTDVSQFEAGDMKGDMGRKPKALAALVRNCVNMFGALNIGMVCTNHTYASQDPYNPDDKISGGNGPIFAASIVVAMKKLKLKEDEDGVKGSDVLGIRSGCKIMKTRYAKPFEDIELHIPYDTGLSLYSGMFNLLEKKKLLVKEGNRYAYTDSDGVIHKYFRKEWNKNENGVLDHVVIDMPKMLATMPEQTTVDDQPE